MKKLLIAPLIELLKRLLWESLTDKIYQYFQQLPKHYISAKFLLIKG